MKHTRGALVATTLLAMALTGCAGGASEEPAKPADPKAAMAASATALKAGNYAFTAKNPETDAKGVVHLPSKSSSLEITSKSAEGGGKFEVRLVEPERWIKMTMDLSVFDSGLKDVDLTDPEAAKFAESMKQMAELFSGKSWMHVDLTKIKEDAAKELGLTAGTDVIGVTALVGAVLTAQGDASTITGTLDATKITEDTGMVTTDDIKAMGAAAASLPYTATLDGEGRLTKLELDVPKAGTTPAGKWTINVTGYGEQKPQEKPTGTVKEMPADAYGMLNGG